ncbi:MAG: FtsQ-type POTRA domain-containing protein [Thermoanaerobaculia bacterium]
MSATFYRPSTTRTPRSPRKRASARSAIALVVFVFIAGGSVAAAALTLRMNARFSVLRVVLDGVPEARRAEAEELTDGWIGKPLLFVDLDTPIARLATRPWVERVSARRVVPDTVTVQVTARRPVALARKDGVLWTVDRAGTWLGPYAGRAVSGADDFVVIDASASAAGVKSSKLPEGQDAAGANGRSVASETCDAGVARGAAFIARLREDDPPLLARLSELEVEPDGFRAVDNVAHMRLRFGPEALSAGSTAAIWRAFLALIPELERHSLLGHEADLRFADRIVLKAPAHDAGRGKT